MSSSRNLDDYEDTTQADDLVQAMQVQQPYSSVGTSNQTAAMQHQDSGSNAVDDGNTAGDEERGRQTNGLSHGDDSERDEIPMKHDDIEALSDIDLQDALGADF